MNRPRRAAALAALALLAVAGCRRPAVERAGEPLPDFRLAALDGRQLGPAELRGKVVLYDFWATWCGPCHIQAATLHELYAGLRGREVEFVAISVGEPEQVVREFVAEHPYPYPVLVDPEDSLSPRLGILGLPTLVVVDRAGGVVFRNTGLVDRRTIEQALARAGA
jgi:peroxiredoxin